jgi:hypothetical protein
MELADMTDLKSVGGNTVAVQPCPLLPNIYNYMSPKRCFIAIDYSGFI